MYKNLKAEMLRQDVSIQQIADALKLKVDSVSRKLSGKVNFTIREAKTISKLFKENNSVDYLFA